jgi:thiol-disulfide isomerase/thioredoxin
MKSINLLFLSVFHFFICAISGIIDWYSQMIIVAFVSALVVIYLSKKNTQFSFIILVIAPFFIFYSLFSILLNSYQTFPIWICGIIVTVIIIAGQKNKILEIQSYVLVLFIVLVTRIYIMPNLFAQLSNVQNASKFNFIGVSFINENNKIIKFDSIPNSIIVMDIWHPGCLPCFRTFPDLEELRKRYKYEKNVKIYSLQIPITNGSTININELLHKYHFEKISFINETIPKNLGVSSVPITLVFNKQKKCIYAGSLNTNEIINFSNIYSIIENNK